MSVAEDARLFILCMLLSGTMDLFTVYQSAHHNVTEALNHHSFYSQLLMRKQMTLAVDAQFHNGQREIYNQRLCTNVN
jgi:hypothetical protein